MFSTYVLGFFLNSSIHRYFFNAVKRYFTMLITGVMTFCSGTTADGIIELQLILLCFRLRSDDLFIPSMWVTSVLYTTITDLCLPSGGAFYNIIIMYY